MDLIANFFDWLAGNSNLIGDFGALLLGIAALLGLFTGFSKYEKSRLAIERQAIQLKEQDQHRQLKFETAREAIDLFHEFKVDIKQIRSPMVFENETKELESLAETSDLIRKAKRYTSGGITLLRLDKHAGTLASINRLRPRFKVLFDTDEPFESVVKVRHKIWVAAHMLATGAADAKSEYHDVIWQTNDDDALATEVWNAVEMIEELCGSVLKGE